jgi:hypothetical protein
VRNSLVYYTISALFAYLIVVLCLSALADKVLRDLANVVFYMEVTLAVYFSLEFLLRLWAVEADAKYIGWKGYIELA